MKRFRFCIISLTGVLLTLVGCKKDETEPTAPASIPKISVSEPRVYTSEAATYTLYYEIENPREGVELELTSEEKWILLRGSGISDCGNSAVRYRPVRNRRK